MRDKLGEIVRIEHMMEAIGFIEQFISRKAKTDLDDNAMLRFAVIKQLEIIGEAANNLSAETKETIAEIEWWKIKGFRNISIHEYFRISTAIVWQVIQADIPVLKSALERYQSL